MNRLQIDTYTHDALAAARKTYGNKNQILVCMEELNELACVLAKYPRYTDEAEATTELKAKVLDEVADVAIILHHVINIFGISEEELDDRMHKKTERLLRWLTKNGSMQTTIDDRTVEGDKPKEESRCGSLCEGCDRRIKAQIDPVEYVEHCRPCYMAQATEGIAPHHT